MSPSRTPLNPSAWVFKPSQADKLAMRNEAKDSPGIRACPKHNLPIRECPDCDSSTWRSSILQGGFGDASLEEQRLKDYSQGKGKHVVISDAIFQHSAVPNVSVPASVSGADKKKLELLRGSGIDIHVGTSGLPCNQWSLPINFISHYSPYLKAASTSNDEGPVEKINLPEHDPAVFGLFVEWMYYGSYSSVLMAPDPHIHAKCWILGDKLECPEFKNYVMRLLYTQQTTFRFAKYVTCEEVQYVCDNTPSSAKLRQYYENFVVRHYATPGKLQGSTEDWDALFQKHSEMRIALLRSMRNSLTSFFLLKDVSEYLEATETLWKPDLKPSEDSTTSPTKENTAKAVQAYVNGKAQEVLQWKFDPKLNEDPAELPVRKETEEKKANEEQKDSQTSIDGKAQDEVREGASTMYHVPQIDARSPSTIRGSGQEDTDETLVSADPKPKSKRRTNRRNKTKRHWVKQASEPSIRDDQQTDDSLSEHEPEQVDPKAVKLEAVRTEQAEAEAEATPEPAEDEGNVSTDSEPDSFADFVKANRERQEAGLPKLY